MNLEILKAIRMLSEQEDPEAAARQDAEADRMIRRYNAEPTSLWLYTDMSIEERMAWAYLAADEMMGAAYAGDQVAQFVEALKNVTGKVEDFWEQIKQKDPQREERLRSLTWDLQSVPLNRVGVYPKFGGFPVEAGSGSVVDTAAYMGTHPDVLPEKRHKVFVLMTKYQTALKFLPPIFVPGGMLRKEPELFEPMDWDIDDGNHRAVAAALAGAEKITAFVGS